MNRAWSPTAGAASTALVGLTGTVVTDGLLDRVEIAFRAYDPCFGCATHSLPGQMPLEVTVRDAGGSVVLRLKRAWVEEGLTGR